MNTAYISALSALGGSGLGAAASIWTTWLMQRFQDRSQRLAQLSAQREHAFSDFIDQASRLYADALTHQLEDPSKLVPLYATIAKLRLFASRDTVACADAAMSQIVEAYYSPNLDFRSKPRRDAETHDILQPFIRACLAEMSS
jgi:hypothetical protein